MAEALIMYLKVFLVGGFICLLAQILIIRTKLTSARILVLFLMIGSVLGGLGVYGYLAEWAGAGATVPLTGFGYTLALGVEKAVEEYGLFGAITGGLTATAAGITAAITLGFLASLVGKSKSK